MGTGGILLTATVVGDWMRYVRADRFSRASVLGVALGGLWLGYVVPPAVGAITATGFSDPTTPLPVNLALGTPAWYAVLLLPLAVLGSVAFSAQTIYSCGLEGVPRIMGRGRVARS